MVKFKSKFSTLVEAAVERYQQGGLLNGDYVRFVNNIKNTDFYKKQTPNMRQKIDEMGLTDLHLKVSQIKSANYAHAPVDGGMHASSDFYADVVTEYAPGLYKDPVTVPLHVLELVDTADALGRQSAPESTVYKNNVHGPEELKGNDSDRSTPTSNATLPGANKWDDSKPGAGNTKGLQALKNESLEQLTERFYTPVKKKHLSEQSFDNGPEPITSAGNVPAEFKHIGDKMYEYRGAYIAPAHADAVSAGFKIVWTISGIYDYAPDAPPYQKNAGNYSKDLRSAKEDIDQYYIDYESELS